MRHHKQPDTEEQNTVYMQLLAGTAVKTTAIRHLHAIK